MARNGPPRARGPRRPMDWEDGNLDSILAAGGVAAAWLQTPSVLRRDYTDPTVMSTMVWGADGNTGAAGAGAIFAFGVIVVSAFDDAVPVGAAIPNPLIDGDADWLYLFNSLRVVDQTPSIERTMEADLWGRSSARRKLGNDKGILLVGSCLVTVWAFHYHVRCLIKE